MRTPASTPFRAPIVKALALALLLVACGIADPGGVPRCGGHPTVQLVSGPPFAFSWAPRCGISTLIVTKLSATSGTEGETVWAFQMPQGETTGPDVAYGQLPKGAMEIAAPQSLVVGERYEVSISNVSGSTVLAVGSLEFTYFLPD